MGGWGKIISIIHAHTRAGAWITCSRYEVSSSQRNQIYCSKSNRGPNCQIRIYQRLHPATTCAVHYISEMVQCLDWRSAGWTSRKMFVNRRSCQGFRSIFSFLVCSFYLEYQQYYVLQYWVWFVPHTGATQNSMIMFLTCCTSLSNICKLLIRSISRSAYEVAPMLPVSTVDWNVFNYGRFTILQILLLYY